MTNTTRNKRSTKWIRVDVQLRVVLAALSVASLVLFVSFCLVFLTLNATFKEVTSGLNANVVLDDLRHSLIRQFLLATGIAVPASAAIGVFYSFRFAGPIHRFKVYFQSLATGDWHQRCSLRSGDDLQDLCVAVNEGVDALRAPLRESRKLAAELSTLIQSGDLGARESSGVSLEQLRARLVRIEQELGRRFPEDAPPSSTRPAAPVPAEAKAESALQS